MEVIEPGHALTAPAVGWATGPLGEVQAGGREIARQTARQARAVADFAASRPASADRSPDQPGSTSAERRAARADVLADVSEWATQELALALSISEKAAEDLLVRSLTLVHHLPRTLAALERGLLHLGHLWVLLDKVAPVTDPRVRARLEEDLLRWVAARDVTTPAQLRAKTNRELIARNARSVARELEAAVRRRGVHVRPDRVSGMAVLSALLTVPEAEALLDALGRHADALDDGDGPPRTRGEKMTDCLLDLVLRAGQNDLAPVQAHLTLVAPVATMAGGDAAGEINGQPVPAETVRALARALGLLPDVASPDAAPVPADTGAEVAADEDLERWWAEVEARALAESGAARRRHLAGSSSASGRSCHRGPRTRERRTTWAPTCREAIHRARTFRVPVLPAAVDAALAPTTSRDRAWGRRAGALPTVRALRSTGSCAHGTGDAVSPAAATACRTGASWTTTASGRTARPRRQPDRLLHAAPPRQAPGARLDVRQSEDGTLTVRTPTGLTASTAPPPF